MRPPRDRCAAKVPGPPNEVFAVACLCTQRRISHSVRASPRHCAGGTAAAAPGGTMRPLIFSGGPDKQNAILVNGGGNLQLNAACGDPANATVATFGGLDPGGASGRSDNITNFEAEAQP